MSKYIAVEKFVNSLDSCKVEIHDEKYSIDDLICLVQSFPTADVEPVVHAHWTGEEIACSHCGRNLDELKDADSYFSSELMYDNDFVHFCPFCGTKMDERR